MRITIKNLMKRKNLNFDELNWKKILKEFFRIIKEEMGS